MKALLLVIVLVAMGFAIYKQQGTISDLQASLADEQAKSSQLQTSLDNAKKELAAVKTAAPPVYASPLATSSPTPAPTPASDWMWKKKSPLDEPVKK